MGPLQGVAPETGLGSVYPVMPVSGTSIWTLFAEPRRRRFDRRVPGGWSGV